MEGKEKLKYDEFAQITEKTSSTVFLCVFLLIRKACSIYKDFAQYCHARNPGEAESSGDSTPSRRLLPSPELEAMKMLSPFQAIRKMSPLLKSDSNSGSVLRNISSKKGSRLGAKLPSTPSGRDKPRNELSFPDVVTAPSTARHIKPMVPSSLGLSAKSTINEPIKLPQIPASPSTSKKPKTRIDSPKIAAKIPNAEHDNVRSGVEEDKKGTAEPKRFAKTKRVPFIDSSALNGMPMSPMINTEGVRLGPYGKQETTGHSRISTFAKEEKRQEEKKQDEMVLCACGNECKADAEGGKCAICMGKLQSSSMSGYLYEKQDAKTLNRFWYSLIGNQLYSTELK